MLRSPGKSFDCFSWDIAKNVELKRDKKDNVPCYEKFGNDMWYGSQNWTNVVNLSLCKGLHPKTRIWGANLYKLMNLQDFFSFEIHTTYIFI